MHLSQVVLQIEDDEVFKTNHSLFKKISLNYRDIQIIDDLSSKYQWIKEIYLHHNNIVELQGIEQFKNLEVISLKSNYIQEMNSLNLIRNKFALKSLNLLHNPIVNDPNCNYKKLQQIFMNLREFNETVNIGYMIEQNTLHQSQSRYVQSKYLIQEINNQLDKENIETRPSNKVVNSRVSSVKNMSRHKINDDEPSLIPSILNTAKFASNKQTHKHLQDFRKQLLKYNDSKSYFLDEFDSKKLIDKRDQQKKNLNNSSKQEIMQSLNLSRISNCQKSNHQQTKQDTSLNFSQIRQSTNILNSDINDQSISEQNDVSVSFQNRLDYHVQEINEDLNILANVFYHRQIKLKVFSGLTQNIQLSNNHLMQQSFSLCIYDNQRQNYINQQSKLLTESAKKIQRSQEHSDEQSIKLSVAEDFNQTIIKIKVFSYFKGLLMCKSSRQQMIQKMSTLKKQGLNSQRTNTQRNASFSLCRTREINLPLKK